MKVNRTKIHIDNKHTSNTNDKPDSFVEIKRFDTKELKEITKRQSEMEKFILEAFE